MSIVYNTGLYGEPRLGVGAFYFDSIITSGYGSIGAFYFGPISKTITIDPVTIIVTAIEPIVIAYQNINNIVSLDPVTIIVSANDPIIFTSKDISVDFVGIPRAGSSPLIVDFTANVILGSSNFKVSSYIWYFDYDNNPTVSVITTSNTIANIYTGYNKQQYSVKLCVTVEPI